MPDAERTESGDLKKKLIPIPPSLRQMNVRKKPEQKSSRQAVQKESKETGTNDTTGSHIYGGMDQSVFKYQVKDNGPHKLQFAERKQPVTTDRSRHRLQEDAMEEEGYVMPSVTSSSDVEFSESEQDGFRVVRKCNNDKAKAAKEDRDEHDLDYEYLSNRDGEESDGP